MYLLYCVAIIYVLSLTIALKDTSKIIFIHCLAFVIFLILSFNSQNQDYDAYLSIFENSNMHSEFGYSYLVDVVKNFDGSHRGIQITLGFLIAFTFLRYYKINKNMVIALSLYAIFPFPIDVIQIRNTFATMFLLNAIIALTDQKKTEFLFWAILAMSFHYFSLIIISVILLSRFHQSKYFNILLISLSFIFAIYGGIGLSLISNLAISRTASAYEAQNIKVISLIIWGGMLVVDIYIFHKLKLSFNDKENYKASLAKSIQFIIVSSLIFSGFLLHIYEFNRLYRFILVMKYIYISLILENLSKKLQVYLLLYTFFITMLLAIYYNNVLDFDYVLFNL